MSSANFTPAPPARPATILCFGEILWDFLPDALYPGGAPFNVAYHLRQHGHNPLLLSAVGRDVLGDELLRRLEGWGVTATHVSRHPSSPTGYVRARLSSTGDAHYEIVTNVAWDFIDAKAPALAAAASARALIFGSLAQRSAANRAVLDKMLAALPASALRIFDVNLRPPHDDLGLAIELAGKATLLKLNSAEAVRLAASVGSPSSGAGEELIARHLAGAIGCAGICITAGERGAGFLHGGHWYWEDARPVAVADTIGAGDAFLAGLVSSLMSGDSEPASLASACRLGEWVASQRGATPSYSNRPAN